MSEFPAWGIHITAGSLRGVKIDEQGGELKIVAHAHIDFSDHVEDITSLDRIQASRNALLKFQTQHDLSDCRVVVSVDGVTAFNRFIEAPHNASTEGLTKLLELEAKQQIPFDLAQVYWDYKVVRVREDDGFVDVLMFAVKKEIVDHRLAKLRELKIPVDACQIAPIALYNLARYEGEVKEGTVIVAVEYDRVDVVFCDDDRPWIRTLPDGVAAMMRDVHRELQPRHRLAVKIVKGDAECSDMRKLLEIERRFAERLANEIARLVRYYEGARTHAAIDDILLVIGSPLAPELASAIRSATKRDVREFKDFKSLRMDEAIVTPELVGGMGVLAHPAGLALQGLDRAELAPKLYPPTVVHVITGRRFLWVASVLVLFVVIGLVWFDVARNENRLNDARERCDDAVGRAEESVKSFDAMSHETNLRDALRPFVEVGRHRLVGTRAARSVLDFLDKLNEGRSVDDRYYLVQLETHGVTGGAVNGGKNPLSRRSIDLVIARMILTTEEATEKEIATDVVDGILRAGGVMKSTLKTRFVSATPSNQAPALVDDRPVRRRFLVAKLVLDYQDAAEENG